MKVVEYDFGSPQLTDAIAQSKFKSRPDWGRNPFGYIALQDHHDEVYFRNIRIRELKADNATAPGTPRPAGRPPSAP